MPKKQDIHFEISERKVLLRVMDLFFVFLFLFAFSNFFHFEYFQLSKDNYLWGVFLALYISLFGTVFQIYDLIVASNQQKSINGILLTTSITTLFYLLTPFYTPSLPSNRLQIVVFYFAIFFGLLTWRFLYIKLLATNRFHKRVLLVCDSDQADFLTKELTKIDPHYHIIAYLHTEERFLENQKKKHQFNWINLTDLEAFVNKNKLSEIVIASQKTEFISADLYHYLLKYLQAGIVVKEYFQVYEEMVQRLPVHYFNKDFYKYFPFNRNNQNQLYFIFSRFIDVLVSIFGIIFFVLILPIILIGNLLANRGSLFYTQERIGKFGKPFTIFKLRTMVKNAEKDGAVFADKNDHRVTKFGNILRRSRLDELPQFFNIIKNDMALIGPRPERPIFVEQIATMMPLYESRHIIKPGITGWAQVQFSYGASFDDSLIKLQYDLFYIKHRNILLDVNIIIKTLSTVLFYKGQ